MAIDLKEQYARIYRYCYFRLGNSVLVEDAAQEAFLQYYQHYLSMGWRNESKGRLQLGYMLLFRSW